MRGLVRHLRFAFRQTRLHPTLSAAVVLTLGLAIGANTAIFSFVNALLIRPFPFRDPDELVEIRSVRGGQPGKLSMREVLDIQEQVGSIEAIAAHTGASGGYNYGGEGRPEEWRAILTTGNLFEVLGVPLERGRRWPLEADRERDFRVVLTHGVWRRAFAGQDDAIGRKISLDHAPGYEITGVAPAGFDFPSGVEVYRSLGGFTNYERRSFRNVVAVARLRPSRTPEQLQAELANVSSRLAAEHPATNAGLAFEATSFRDLYTGNVRPYLVFLLAAVGFVLLIACSNVVNLLLARALGRGREMAVRAALGAGRGELVAQLLTETTVLALLAGSLGLLLDSWWMRLLRTAVGVELPAWMVVEMDARVLAFTLAVALVAGILSGLAPALHFTRPSLATTLKEAARGGSSGRSAGLLRDGLIVAQVAVAMVLLAGAGLLMRGFADLMARDRGFRNEGIATFRVALGWKRYIDQRTIAQYYERALSALQDLPGVSGAGFVTHPPLSRQEESVPTTVQAEGQPLDEVRRNPYVVNQSVSEGYFQLLGIPLDSGRLFTTFDGPEGEPVAIVSARLAERLWPGEEAVGKRLRYDPLNPKPEPFRTVVGVVGDVVQESLGGEASHDLYVPYRQWAAANQYLLSRTTLPLAAFQAQAERALWAIDPEQSLFDFQLYEKRVLDGIWPLRLSRRLLLVFGAVALLLAAIGVYGVLSHAAAERTREIGIRLALGATPESVRGLVAAHGLRLGAIGLSLGIVAALALGRVLARTFSAVPALDIPSVLGALAALGGVTALASFLPARLASRADPVTVLRDE
jgi:predicted permease